MEAARIIIAIILHLHPFLQMNYNKEAHEIDFKKYEYDTKNIIELIRLDSITGLPVK